MHIGNTDKNYFLFDSSDLYGLHLEALHFTLNNCILPDLTVGLTTTNKSWVSITYRLSVSIDNPSIDYLSIAYRLEPIIDFIDWWGLGLHNVCLSSCYQAKLPCLFSVNKIG